MMNRKVVEHVFKHHCEGHIKVGTMLFYFKMKLRWTSKYTSLSIKNHKKEDLWKEKHLKVKIPPFITQPHSGKFIIV